LPDGPMEMLTFTRALLGPLGGAPSSAGCQHLRRTLGVLAATTPFISPAESCPPPGVGPLGAWVCGPGTLFTMPDVSSGDAGAAGAAGAAEAFGQGLPRAGRAAATEGAVAG